VIKPEDLDAEQTAAPPWRRGCFVAQGCKVIRLCSSVLQVGLICLLVFNVCQSHAMTEGSWEKTYKAGVDALDTNRYWLAEPLLQQAVSQAELFGANDLRLARSLSDLGRYYDVRGRFMDAQPFYERELHVRRLWAEDDDGKIIPFLGTLIRFYLNHGTASKADPLADDVINVLEGKMREVHIHEAKTTMKAGQALEGYAGTAAPINRDPLIEWAITCDAIGNAYQARGNYKFAERFYKAALDTKATVLGKGHLSLASSYESLGSLALEKGDYAEAESYYKDALSTTEITLPAESIEVYSRLDKLARCYIKDKKFGEAEALYQRSLGFWSKEPSKYGNDNRALFSLGALYCDEKKYSAAAPVLRRALRMAERFNGPSSLGLVPYLQKYAYVLYHLGQRGESANLNARALAITGPPPPKPKEEKDSSEAAQQANSKMGKKGKSSSKREKSLARKRSGSRHRRRSR
jgi:tetratricopeptide (TPR) repeat protein